jgi:hypothetical protein
MHNPLVIESIMLIAAILVGVWSQRALPLHADSRPILFLLCLFVGTGSALCLLLDGLSPAVNRSGRDGRCANIRPVAAAGGAVETSQRVVGIIEDFCSGEPKKGRAKASATADDADPLPLRRA